MCVEKIHMLISNPLSDMQTIWLCVTLCINNPEIIKMEAPLCRNSKEEIPSDTKKTTVDTYGFIDKLIYFGL